MVRDFGGSVPPRWRKGQRLAVLRLAGGRVFLAAALLLIAVLPVAMPASLEETIILGHRRKPVADRPCQPISEAVFNRGWTDDPRIFTFAGVTFARRRADADCSSGKHGLLGVMGAIYPVCRFDAPFQLAVIDHGRTRYFAVPAGYTAVVEAAPEETRCKVTGRYDLYSLEG